MHPLLVKLHRVYQDYAPGAWWLAGVYGDGWGWMNADKKRKVYVRKSRRKEFYWTHRAAQLGETSAMLNVASCLSTGYGCEKNIREALKWEKKALRLGNDTAIHNLGCSYRMLHKYRLAHRWFQKAYALDKDSAFDLGKCYLFGQGVRKDTSIAVRYFREIASAYSDPLTKIHAMRLIADIQCKSPPTTKPLSFRRLPLPLMGKYAKCYKKELHRNPKNEGACYCLAQLYYGHKLYKESIPYLRKCRQLSFCPEDHNRWLSTAYYKLKNIRGEMGVYRRILRQQPDDIDALNNLGACYIDLGNNQQALELLHKAQSLAGRRPGFGRIRRNSKRAQNL